MRMFKLTLTAVAVVVFAAGISGCGSSEEPAPDTSSTSPPAEMGHGEQADHSGHGDHGDHAGGDQSDMEKMKEGLAKLSDEDRAAAEKQHMCPVSNKMLGTMGAPIKVDVNGQDVWICCAGCESTLLDNPDEYLAKLKQ